MGKQTAFNVNTKSLLITFSDLKLNTCMRKWRELKTTQTKINKEHFSSLSVLRPCIDSPSLSCARSSNEAANSTTLANYCKLLQWNIRKPLFRPFYLNVSPSEASLTKQLENNELFGKLTAARTPVFSEIVDRFSCSYSLAHCVCLLHPISPFVNLQLPEKKNKTPSSFYDQQPNLQVVQERWFHVFFFSVSDTVHTLDQTGVILGHEVNLSVTPGTNWGCVCVLGEKKMRDWCGCWG